MTLKSPALAGKFFTTTAAAATKTLQSCLTVCNSMDGSPPGSSVHGIFQARAPEWVAIAFSTLPLLQMNLFTKQRLTDIENTLVVTKGESGGGIN